MASDAPNGSAPLRGIPVIAVDGPSGVGKGTVTRWLARRLTWHRLDSGALYRLAAIAATDAGIEPTDVPALEQACTDLEAHFSDAEGERVFLAGQDVTARLRLESTGVLASRISALPRVRTALLKRQRRFRRAPGLVADGRDMGTVVFADAMLKIFLDADPRERARRRWLQLRKTGTNVSLNDLCKEIEARDARDRNRATAPLRPAPDAVLLDSTHLSIEGVEARIEDLLAARGIIA